MRLIDADKLIAEYDRVHIGPPGGARKLMQDAPTVDAVEVVRCEKCDYYDESGEYCKHWHGVRHPEHFCDDGERRTK